MTTFTDIREWAKATIESVEGANKVWPYRRQVRNQEQLLADFGTDDTDGEAFRVTRGWMLWIRKREPEAPVGGFADVTYELRYVCLWSVAERGATELAHNNHVLEVVTALSAEARPETISGIDEVFPAVIDDLYTVVWPLEGGRTHHRADVSQVLRLHEQIRS